MREQVKALFHFACIANRKKDATFFVQARDLSLAAETIWWTSRPWSSTRTRSGSLQCRQKRSWNISFHPSSILEESKTHLTTVNIFGCSWFDNYSFRDWYFIGRWDEALLYAGLFWFNSVTKKCQKIQEMVDFLAVAEIWRFTLRCFWVIVLRRSILNSHFSTYNIYKTLFLLSLIFKVKW